MGMVDPLLQAGTRPTETPGLGAPSLATATALAVPENAGTL